MVYTRSGKIEEIIKVLKDWMTGRGIGFGQGYKTGGKAGMQDVWMR